MSFNLKDFPHMILNYRVQDKMSCFDMSARCPTASLIPEYVSTKLSHMINM